MHVRIRKQKSKMMKSFQESLPIFIEFVEKLPEISSNLLKKIEKGELDINLNLKGERKIVLARK